MSAEELVVSDIGEHMGTKGMWAGGLDPANIPNLLGAIPAAPATPSADESDAESDTASVASGESASEAAGLAHSPITIVEITRPHTPALLKAIDEIIGNATDRDGDIEISFDPATGRIIVLNHGSCVPIVEHEAHGEIAVGEQIHRIAARGAGACDRDFPYDRPRELTLGAAVEGEETLAAPAAGPLAWLIRC